MTRGLYKKTIINTHNNMEPPEHSYPSTASLGYFNITEAHEKAINPIL